MELVRSKTPSLALKAPLAASPEPADSFDLLGPSTPELKPRMRAALASSRDGLTLLPGLFEDAIRATLHARRLTGPLPSGSPQAVLAGARAALGPARIPDVGCGSKVALRRVAHVLSEFGLDLSHPRALAHLQPPVLSTAVVADALAALSNGSLDTYDSGPAGIALERWLISALCRRAGFSSEADGVMTPGGSLSNLVALMLARDAAATRLGLSPRMDGIAALPSPRVYCSELAHFSVQRACATIGLGEGCVIPIPVDAKRRMRVSELASALTLRPQTPIAIVATAGTTDFGSIDPLPEITELARRHGVWLHVDAAYGFGALFSQRLASKLTGLECADSITLDLHKLGWQPAAASTLLVADARSFVSLEREVAYLNPSDDSERGFDGLLGCSLQTTRRCDAAKVVATFLAYGERGLGEMVETCHDLARYAEHRIAGEPELQLVSEAELTTVTFRYVGDGTNNPEAADRLNAELRRHLIEQGTALLGRTSARPPGEDPAQRVCLKFTLLNPTATKGDIDDVVHAVLHAGRTLLAPELGGE